MPWRLPCCRDPEKIFAFATDCANHVVEAYLPIIARHKEQPYSVKEKEWQQIRRGKYAEYNVIYDRGTIFGLQTGGRTESILMSLPLTGGCCGQWCLVIRICRLCVRCRGESPCSAQAAQGAALLGGMRAALSVAGLSWAGAGLCRLLPCQHDAPEDACV